MELRKKKKKRNDNNDEIDLLIGTSDDSSALSTSSINVSKYLRINYCGELFSTSLSRCLVLPLVLPNDRLNCIFIMTLTYLISDRWDNEYITNGGDTFKYKNLTSEKKREKRRSGEGRGTEIRTNWRRIDIFFFREK